MNKGKVSEKAGRVSQKAKVSQIAGSHILNTAGSHRGQGPRVLHIEQRPALAEGRV